MNNFKDYIEPGVVVWANRNIFYDQPDKIITDKINMFLVLKKDDNSFYGCKLDKNPVDGTSNVLRKKFYPLKYDSRVSADIYKIDFDSIANTCTFKVTEGTLSNIKRNIYKRIVLGYNQGPIEYQEEFVKDYIKEHRPETDNIIAYATNEKKYQYFYIYENEDEYYSLIKLKREGINYFSLESSNEVLMPKTIPYFDYYTSHNLTRDNVDKYLFGNKEKKLGNIINK